MQRSVRQLLISSRRYASLLDATESGGTLSENVPGSWPDDNLPESSERKTKTKVVSRLTERHRLIAEGRLPPISYDWEKERWAKAERFGTYGLACGVDPGELWPSVEEIQEEEAVGWYRKYSDIMKEVQIKKEAECAAATARLKKIAAIENKYPEMLKEYQENQKEIAPVKTKQQLEAEQQASDMLEYYGYEILPDDPRFPILFEKMTEAKKKAAKLAEKEELSKKKRVSRKKEKEKKEENS